MLLQNFTRTDKVISADLRKFADGFIRATSREADKFCVITYYKNRKVNQQLINEKSSQLVQLERDLNEAYEEENQMEINSLKSQINALEYAISREAEEIRLQPAKVVINEGDLPFFLRLIDESGKFEVYEALKATGLRLNEFINKDNLPENPSSQGILEDA